MGSDHEKRSGTWGTCETEREYRGGMENVPPAARGGKKKNREKQRERERERERKGKNLTASEDPDPS
jgi:hypothetical protein